MIIVGQALVSEDVLQKRFACQLSKCHGACCVEGDAGAPLEAEEVSVLSKEFSNIRPFLSEEGLAHIETHGVSEQDKDGDSVTVCRPTGECVFVVYEGPVAVCGIEKAYNAGATSFKKPISCHLYPIRAKNYGEYIALNYHHWEICSPACDNGKSLNLPVYKFLQEALVRKMGKDWFDELDEIAKQF